MHSINFQTFQIYYLYLLQKAKNLPDGAVISPFFNNTKKPIDKPNDVPITQSGSELFVNSQMGINPYFGRILFSILFNIICDHFIKVLFLDNLPFSCPSNVDLGNSMEIDKGKLLINDLTCLYSRCI